MLGVTATTAEELSVGAGILFYKPSTGTGSGANDPWLEIGATTEDNVWRHILEIISADINNVVGQIKGGDYKSNEQGELEFSPLQHSAAIMGLLAPGSTVTAAPTPAEVSGGATGGLDAAITAGQTLAIKVDSVTGLSVGGFIRVGPSGGREVRRVTRVGTVGSGGTGIDVEYPFLLDHADTETYVEVDAAPIATVVPSATRRIPSDAYNHFRLDVPGLDGRARRYFVYDGLMLENGEVTASDDEFSAPRFTIQSRVDPANPSRGGWKIEDEEQVA